MLLYKRRRNGRSFKQKFEKSLETTLKSLVIMLSAAPFSWATTAFWYCGLYRNDIHLSRELEIIATASWIPFVGFLYGLLALTVVTTVFGEYKRMREAIKSYDLETFMTLVNEDLSPLIHALMSIMAFAVLAAFMLLAYPDPIGGVIIVGSISYLFAFIFIVVREIDEPLAGIWFIKNVPEEWLRIDVKQWWLFNRQEKRKGLAKLLMA